MRIWSRSLAAILTLAVLSAPVHADVARARKSAAPEAVRTRLEALGEARASTDATLARLTPAETRFFAADPSRVQVVGVQQDFFTGESVNLWYETLLGGFMLAAGVGGLYFMTHNRE